MKWMMNNYNCNMNIMNVITCDLMSIAVEVG